MQWRWTQSGTHRGGLELTKHSEMSSIAPKVGSTEFTDIAVDNDFIPYYSGGDFKKKQVNSRKGRWIQERAGEFTNSAKYGIRE